MELLNKFLVHEFDKSLFSKEIMGVKYWIYIRFYVYSEITRIKFNTGFNNMPSKKEIKNRISLKEIVTKFKYLVNMNAMLGLSQTDILVLNHPRRIKNKSNYECIYTDEILSHLPYSYTVLEQSVNSTHYQPIQTKNIKYMDYINLCKGIRKYFYRVLEKYNIIDLTKEEEEVNKIIIELNEKFGVFLDRNVIMNKIKDVAFDYKLSKKYYSKILEKVKPKLLIEVVYYGRDRLVFNELAKERGIKVLEMQHGTMGKHHIAYNFYKEINIDAFPDYIFLFGVFWKETTRLPVPKEHLFITGFPYFEKKINKNCNVDRCNKGKTIIFISQGNIGIVLSKIAVELNTMLNKSDFNIIYKLHPGEYDRWHTEYPWLYDQKGIEVIDSNNEDIYYYLSKANYQVGVASTAIFEGLGFDLITFIYKAPFHQYAEELYNNGYATLVTSAREIHNNLILYNNDLSALRNRFWEKDALNKVLEDIDYLMNS